MTAEITPAVERAARVASAFGREGAPFTAPAYWQEHVTAVLTAALDVEEMARVAYAEGAWCGVCEYEGWDACADCRSTLIGYATAIRNAILGSAS